VNATGSGRPAQVAQPAAGTVAPVDTQSLPVLRVALDCGAWAAGQPTRR